MKNLQEDITIYGGKIDKNFPEDFKDVSRDLANNLVKKEYSGNQEEVDDEINNRIKEETINRRWVASQNLSRVFNNISKYESWFKNYNSSLKNFFEQKGRFSPMNYNLSESSNLKEKYKQNLIYLNISNIDLPGLPTELNYLERLN